MHSMGFGTPSWLCLGFGLVLRIYALRWSLATWLGIHGREREGTVWMFIKTRHERVWDLACRDVVTAREHLGLVAGLLARLM